MTEDRRQLDDLIAQLTLARRDRVQARDDVQAAMRRGEDARVRAQHLERSISTLIDRMTDVGAGAGDITPTAS